MLWVGKFKIVGKGHLITSEKQYPGKFGGKKKKGVWDECFQKRETQIIMKVQMSGWCIDIFNNMTEEGEVDIFVAWLKKGKEFGYIFWNFLCAPYLSQCQKWLSWPLLLSEHSQEYFHGCRQCAWNVWPSRLGRSRPARRLWPPLHCRPAAFQGNPWRGQRGNPSWERRRSWKSKILYDLCAESTSTLAPRKDGPGDFPP